MTDVNEVVHTVHTQPDALVKFDPVRAIVKQAEADNAVLNFDYEDPDQNKLARSHVYKLRQGKTQITKVHTSVKAGALTFCQEVDAVKRDLIGSMDRMIAPHDKAIKELEEREAATILAGQERARLEVERLEEERLSELDAREASIRAEEERLGEERRARKTAEVVEQAAAEKEASRKVAEEVKRSAEAAAKLEAAARAREAATKLELDKMATERAKLEEEKRALAVAKQAEIDAKAREKEAKEQAEKQAAFDKAAAIKKAEQDKIVAINEERERVAKIDADVIAAAKAEADAEAKRVAEEKQRKEIEREVYDVICELLADGCDADDIMLNLIEGKIPHTTINY